MELKTLIETRYAAKSFDPAKRIDTPKIEQLKELIRLSPSSFNIQPWRVRIVTDQRMKDLLTAASWNQPQIKTASHVFVFLADTNVAQRITDLIALMEKNGAPKGSLKGYEDMMRGSLLGRSADELRHWAQKQVYIALENGLLGAKELGFDSCPMEGFDPAEYSRILGLPQHLVPTVVMPVGYATDAPRPKARFDMKDVFM